MRDLHPVGVLVCGGGSSGDAASLLGARRSPSINLHRYAVRRGVKIRGGAMKRDVKICSGVVERW
jgi:hypothetical protein